MAETSITFAELQQQLSVGVLAVLQGVLSLDR
jgi:hypothetical protein